MNKISETYWQDQVKAYIAQRISEGMTYINVFNVPCEYDQPFDEEEWCEEFMRMVNAPSVPDPEVLGKYSP
jgi:hypothetical protein